MSVFLTIFAGVSVFVMGQLWLRLTVEPLQRFRETLGEVDEALVYYARELNNTSPPDTNSIGYKRRDEASERLRVLAGLLRVRMTSLVGFGYETWLAWGFIPSSDGTIEASNKLIGLSNRAHARSREDIDHNAHAIVEIGQLLSCYPMRLRDVVWTTAGWIVSWAKGLVRWG